jgi:1-acyl-sn-glycerol-3-phosphate acyltransferase
MSKTADVVNSFLKLLIGLAVKVDEQILEQVPWKGPLILVANHINFLEVPLMYSYLYPRPITGWAKYENWKNPFLALLFNLFNAIPIRRGERDLNAMTRAVAALKSGMILAISPEGTRSSVGKLAQGKPGVVLLAQRSSAPILPIAYYGGELVWRKLARLRWTHFHIRVGRPFRVAADSDMLSRDIRQEITDEIMYQLAALLPQYYRGYYCDMTRAKETYLLFDEGVASNLLFTAETDRLDQAR